MIHTSCESHPIPEHAYERKSFCAYLAVFVGQGVELSVQFSTFLFQPTTCDMERNSGEFCITSFFFCRKMSPGCYRRRFWFLAV
mmetsp:Transcript_30229/g.49493  ORF Transcript_30229/g.49493 Transcript_30229/m.49493 type:complete len:84 (+) Transcript_30229:1213-1464(+)